MISLALIAAIVLALIIALPMQAHAQSADITTNKKIDTLVAGALKNATSTKTNTNVTNTISQLEKLDSALERTNSLADNTLTLLDQL
jgi:hypothetical protein